MGSLDTGSTGAKGSLDTGSEGEGGSNITETVSFPEALGIQQSISESVTIQVT